MSRAMISNFDQHDWLVAIWHLKYNTFSSMKADFDILSIVFKLNLNLNEHFSHMVVHNGGAICFITTPVYLYYSHCYS